MAFRLPRLPETGEIVEPNRRPSLQFQRWWQSVVKKLETQESTQDELLVAIAMALEQAGIAIEMAGAIMPDLAPVTVQADYTGVVLPGQLPRSITAQRFSEDDDVTTSSDWSATTESGEATYSIGAATGILEITGLAMTTVINVTSEYDGITRSKKLTVYKQLADPPPSSGSNTEYDSSITSTTSDAYGTENAGPLTVTCGASGEIDLAAPLHTTVNASIDGDYYAVGKWQVSPAGAGTWSDVDTEIIASTPARQAPGLFAEGLIEVNQQATGLTPASDYDFRLLLRNLSAIPHTLYYSGIASVTPS